MLRARGNGIESLGEQRTVFSLRAKIASVAFPDRHPRSRGEAVKPEVAATIKRIQDLTLLSPVAFDFWRSLYAF